MKNEDETVAAFEVLWRNAETDFERHRIKSLLKDLAYGEPKVEQVDDKHQKFDGITYKKDKQGHYAKINFVHQAVWRYHHGEIPEGYVIHHIDEDKANNDLANLKCVTKAEHRIIHNDLQVRSKDFCRYCGRPITVVWGQPYCSAYCRHMDNGITKICQFCGKEFQSTSYSKTKFCSLSCYHKYRVEFEREERVCPNCGKTFIAKKSSEKVCCSHKCSGEYRWRGHKEYRKCKNCGKEFMIPKSVRQVFCSKKCREQYNSVTDKTTP